jgi:hypothetical protein
MKKAIQVLSLFVLVVALGGCSYKNDSNQITQLQKQNQDLQIQLAKQPPISDLDLQAKCSAKAKDFFDNYKQQNLGYNDIYGYENHYNSKLGKCYILIRGDGPNGSSNQLWDAYENKDVAECEGYSGNATMNFCGYSGLSEKYDLDKFNSFIKQYMEN